MKTEHIKAISHLMAYARMSESEKKTLWDCILHYQLALTTFQSLKKMRQSISEMVNGGACFNFSTIVYKKADIEGQIIGQEAVLKTIEDRLIDTMSNMGLKQETKKLFEVLHGLI